MELMPTNTPGLKKYPNATVLNGVLCAPWLAKIPTTLFDAMDNRIRKRGMSHKTATLEAFNLWLALENLPPEKRAAILATIGTPEKK